MKYCVEKDVSVSCTDKDDLVYVIRGLVDSHEKEVVQIRLKQQVPSKWIFLPCPLHNHFTELICGQH